MTAHGKQIGGDHYRTLEIQPSDYIYRNKLGWHEGNAVKYITRHRIKGGRADIEKAIHYLELLLEAEYGAPPATPVRVRVEGYPVTRCATCQNEFCTCYWQP